MTFLKYFCYVLAAALLSSIIGGVFASAVALISPEFVKGLFSPHEGASLTRYAASRDDLGGIYRGRCHGNLSRAGDTRTNRQSICEEEERG